MSEVIANLENKRCVPCEGGIPALTTAQAQAHAASLSRSWDLNQKATTLSLDFKFKNYYHTMSFVNAVVYIAHAENHHPDLSVSFNHCKVLYTTHAINGLSLNDFICAEKVNHLYAATQKD